jgi:hypothetical protein
MANLTNSYVPCVVPIEDEQRNGCFYGWNCINFKNLIYEDTHKRVVFL